MGNFLWKKSGFLCSAFKNSKWEKNSWALGKQKKEKLEYHTGIKYHRSKNSLNSFWWHLLVSEKSICLHRTTVSCCRSVNYQKKIISSMQDQFLYFVHSRQKFKWAGESGLLGHILVAGKKWAYSICSSTTECSFKAFIKLRSYYLVPFRVRWDFPPLIPTI